MSHAQYIAKRGGYGAYLLEKSDTAVSIVRKLHEHLCVPVTCKIRILPQGVEATIALAKALQDAGCSILTVHGRTKEQKKVCVWREGGGAFKNTPTRLKVFCRPPAPLHSRCKRGLATGRPSSG